jgi:hypothetical protein
VLIGTIPPAQLAAGTPRDTATNGQITITGSVRALSCASTGNATIAVSGDVTLLSCTTVGNGTINIGSSGSGKPVRAQIGTLMSGGMFQCSDPVSSLQLGSAQSDSSVVAPTIGKLSIAGDFDAALTITGSTNVATALGSVVIGGSVSAASAGDDRWAINGNVGRIRIDGSVTNLQLLGGARLGPDGELSSPPAGYSGTTILLIEVLGDLSSSLLSSGLDPVDGVLLNGNDQLLPGSALGSLIVNGSMSGDSRVIAASVPTFAIITGHKISTAGDPRFSAMMP